MFKYSIYLWYIMISNKTNCPKCKGKNTKKRGQRQTENRGKIQRYFCKDCLFSFVKDDGFYRMRNAPQKVTLCLDLFYRGISTRKVQEHLRAFYPHNADHRTILRWIVKYAQMIHNFTDKLKINCGEEIQIDEMEFKTKGKRSWLVDCIDTETRYMIGSEYSKGRSKKELKSVLKSAKEKTGDQVKIVTSDGFYAYRKVVKSVFGYNNKLGKYNVDHNIVTQLKNEGFNHKIERLHNNIRARTKIFRGFKSVHSANAIMLGYQIFYNFIREHQALGKCPYELAVPELKLGLNKWLDLIQISKKQ